MKKCTVELLETCFDGYLNKFIGKNVVMYDEHHGSARFVKNASIEKLEELYDENTTIIVIT